MVVIKSPRAVFGVQIVCPPLTGVGVQVRHGTVIVVLFSPLMTTSGVLSSIKNGAEISPQTLATVGIVGAVVSRVTTAVHVDVLVAGSVTVTVGFDVRIVPLHTTSPHVDGFAAQLRFGIEVISPLAILVQVTRACPLVGSGVAVQIGATGGVVSNVTSASPVDVFPA